MEEIKNAVERTHLELNSEYGYLEKHYQSVLCHYIRKSMPGAVVSLEVNLPYRTTDGFCFYNGRMDVVVETETKYIILELKAHLDKRNGFKSAIGQTKRYISNVRTNKELFAMLIVFGGLSPVVRYLQKYGVDIEWDKVFPEQTFDYYNEYEQFLFNTGIIWEKKIIDKYLSDTISFVKKT